MNVFLADEAERALIPDPQRFLEDAFRRETGLTEIREARLWEMTPTRFISTLLPTPSSGRAVTCSHS